jgi:hypothetical protein
MWKSMRCLRLSPPRRSVAVDGRPTRRKSEWLIAATPGGRRGWRGFIDHGQAECSACRLQSGRQAVSNRKAIWNFAIRCQEGTGAGHASRSPIIIRSDRDANTSRLLSEVRSLLATARERSGTALTGYRFTRLADRRGRQTCDFWFFANWLNSENLQRHRPGQHGGKNISAVLINT